MIYVMIIEKINNTLRMRRDLAGYRLFFAYLYYSRLFYKSQFENRDESLFFSLFVRGVGYSDGEQV